MDVTVANRRYVGTFTPGAGGTPGVLSITRTDRNGPAPDIELYNDVQNLPAAEALFDNILVLVSALILVQ